jgi:DNA invertase Pin-like site-specific DNA recombinase
MKVGYARVSTPDQKLDLQIDALKADGCDPIFTDTSTGAKKERPGLNEALRYLRPEDTLVVWKLDRLGRSVKNLVDSIKMLDDQKVAFKSLQENIDTNTSGGKLVFHIFSALAEFERDLIKERTKAGLNSARARGRYGGRPRLLDDRKLARMVELYDEKKNTVAEICRIYNISTPSFYVYMKRYREKVSLKKENETEMSA